MNSNIANCAFAVGRLSLLATVFLGTMLLVGCGDSGKDTGSNKPATTAGKDGAISGSESNKETGENDGVARNTDASNKVPDGGDTGGKEGGGGQGDSHDAVMADVVMLLKKATESLAGVKDKETATAAFDRLKAIALKMGDLDQRWRTIGEPGEAELQALQDKYKGQLKDAGIEAAKTLAKVAFRVGKIGGTKALGELKDAWIEVKNAVKAFTDKK